MKKVYIDGKVDWVRTFKFNMPTKKRTRSRKVIRQDLKKTERILAM